VGVHVSRAAGDEFDDGVSDEAVADAVGDAERERDRQQDQERGDGGLRVVEVHAGHLRDHEEADEDQRGRGGRGRDHAGEGGEELGEAGEGDGPAFQTDLHALDEVIAGGGQVPGAAFRVRRGGEAGDIGADVVEGAEVEGAAGHGGNVERQMSNVKSREKNPGRRCALPRRGVRSQCGWS